MKIEFDNDENEALNKAKVSSSADGICMQQCESCQKEFDIENMIEGKQYFCRECYNELSEDEEFVRGTSYLEDDLIDDFQE
ncbi:MAG: hypothetical protein IPG12_14270 [Saprospiraceae bacterium]|nr:hypothetical protein [Saprospiraceae bacterium]